MKVAVVLLITSWCNVITALRILDLDWRESSPFILDHFSSNDDRDKSEENHSLSSSSYELVDKNSPSGSTVQESSPNEIRRNDGEDLDTADSVSTQSKEDPLQEILPKVKFVCKGRAEGYYADTDFDCEVFHYCKTSGFRFTFVCPPKSKFNQKQMTCDYEAKDTICMDAIRHQKQQMNKQISLAPSLVKELTSESIESIKSSHPGMSSNKVMENKKGNKEMENKKDQSSGASEASIPMKQQRADHTSLISFASVSGPVTTTPSSNYYQFTGNSDKYVSPQVFEVTPKATTPVPTTSPSPVYKGEDSTGKESTGKESTGKESTGKQASNPSQSSATSKYEIPAKKSSLPSPPFNYSGFTLNVNEEDESFKPISLKVDASSSKVSSPGNSNNYYHQKEHTQGEEESEKSSGGGSNDQQESYPISSSSPSSPPSPAFSIVWNHEQANSFSSFKPSQPIQMKYSKSTPNYNSKPKQGVEKEQQGTMKLKISDPSTNPLSSSFLLPSPPTMTTIQLHQFLSGRDIPTRSLFPEKQQKYSSSLQSSLQSFHLNPKYNNEQVPLGFDYQDGGMMLSNYELQPLVSENNLGLDKITTTVTPPTVMVTRTPQNTFAQNIFAQFSPESFKPSDLSGFQKTLKLKPEVSLKPPPSSLNQLTQSSLTTNQLSSLLNSGSFSAFEELEDIGAAKFPPTDHMFGLPKVSGPKKQNQQHFEHQSQEQIPHNFHTQIPHMMPFNNNHHFGNMASNVNMNHGMNSQTVGNGGSFISELNNLFSKHFTRTRPGNLLPSRPPSTIHLPKFSPNALTSWFNKGPKDQNVNLMASSSQHTYPSFAEPPSPTPPSPPPPSPRPNNHPQQPKWGIFTSITKFFNSPQSPQPQSGSNDLNGFRSLTENKFTGLNQMQTVPLNFYHHQPPPRIQFRPLSMAPNTTRPVFKLAMSVDPDTQEDDEEEMGEGKGSESGMNSWNRFEGIQRKVEEGSNQLSGNNFTTNAESSRINSGNRRNYTIRSPRRKRQIFGLKSIETNNIPNMYPIFTSSDFNENLFMSSPSFLDSLTFLPATIVTQRSKNRPPMGNRFVDHTDGFSNPFPTVPLPTFERNPIKSNKVKQLFIKPDVSNQMLPSFSAPPLKYNPRTGTFYEPIFGSEIPIHLTFSDFQRVPDNLLKKPRGETERVKTSSSNEDRTPQHHQNVPHHRQNSHEKQHSRPSSYPSFIDQGKGNGGEKMGAKVLSYEYMYRPVVTNSNNPLSSSRKRQPVKESSGSGSVPLAQVTYEKVNIPPLRLNDELISQKYHQVIPDKIVSQKYHRVIPDKLPANPRRPSSLLPTNKHHGDEVEVFRPPINEPRPRFVASLNSDIDKIVHQNSFDPLKPSLNSDRPFYPAENVVDERKPTYHKPTVKNVVDERKPTYHKPTVKNVVDERKPTYYKPTMNYESEHSSRNREPPQPSWVPEEIPIRQTIPKQFIPYETPDVPNHLSEQSNHESGKNGEWKNEYRNTNDRNQGSQTKVDYSVSNNNNKNNRNYDNNNNNNNNYDNHDHRYYPESDAVHESLVTTVIPPSTTFSYRPQSTFISRPASTVSQETNHLRNSVTPVYGQKIHPNSNNNYNRNDSYNRNNNYNSNDSYNSSNNYNQFVTNHLNTNRERYENSNNKKVIVIEKQWYPEAPYTRVYTTPSTTTTTEGSATTSTYSEWPVFKKHQNYLPPVNTGIKPVTLNDFEEETVVEDGSSETSVDNDQTEKEGSNSEYAPKYPETFSVPQHYTTSPPITPETFSIPQHYTTSPPITPSTNMYYDHYPSSESPVDNYSEYPSSVKNHHETKSDSEEIPVKVDREETTTPIVTKVEEEEVKKDFKIKVFGSKKNDYSKLLNRYRGGSSTKKPSPTSPPVAEPTWQTPTIITTTSASPQGSSKHFTSYGTRVGVTRAPKTRVSVVASVSTSSVMRKPVYTNSFDSKNQDVEESRSVNSKNQDVEESRSVNSKNQDVEESRSVNSKSEGVIPTRKPGYHTYQPGRSTTKIPERHSSSSISRESKVPSRDWKRYRSSSSSSSRSTTTTTTQTVPSSTTTVQAVPSSTTTVQAVPSSTMTVRTVPSSTMTVGSTTTLGTTSSPVMSTTPALFTGKVQNFATLFDTIDSEEPLEGDYDVVEEQPSNREEKEDSTPSLLSTTSVSPTTQSSSSSSQSSSSPSQSSSSPSQSFLKVYSNNSAGGGALNSRLSGLRMKHLFRWVEDGQKKRLETISPPS